MKEPGHTKQDPLVQQLQSLRYPGTVDVTDTVMAKVRTMPLLTPYQLRRQRFQRVATAVAACAVLAVAINITLLFTHNYNEAQISDVIASVYDYNAEYGTTTHTHQMAAIEYLYE